MNLEPTLSPDLALTTGHETTRRRLLQIAPEAYRHPLDQQATTSLKAVPGFELAISKLSRFGIEQLLYVEMLASAIRVTPKQCGRIHNLLMEACSILDVPTPPTLFLTQTPIVNAFAMGRENPIMVLHTGLVEHLTDEELLGVIGHELGHIHCGHTVYLLMLLLIQLAARLGGGRLGGPQLADAFSMPIQMALLEWLRKAEFSADRAAILVTQNPDTVFSALFKLTGGSPKIFEQMDREEYLNQAEEYDKLDKGRLNRMYKTAIEADKTHPIPVLRAREVLRWGGSDDLKAILEGRYVRRDKNGALASASAAPVLCPQCNRYTDGAFTFCTHCGASLPPPALLEAEAGAEGEANG